MFHQIKNSFYQTRNRNSPSTTCTIDDVGISSKTLNGERFILHNWKHTTFESLKQLSKNDNDHLVFDGTFKSCPNLFYRFYSVHSGNSQLSTQFITW